MKFLQCIMGVATAVDSKEFVQFFYKGSLVFQGFIERQRPEQEIHSLIQHYQLTGDETSRNIILESHTRTVYGQAAEHARTRFTHPSEYMAEGFIGLQKAIEEFDPAEGVKFTTYAIRGIKEHMNQYTKRYAKSITLPHNLVTYVLIAERIYGEKWVDDPVFVQQFADERNISKENLLKTHHVMRYTKGLSFPPVDYQQDHRDLHPLEVLLEQERSKALWKALRVLGDRDNIILKKRYALNGYESVHTLKEIGKHFNVSGNRISQIEQRALKKMQQILQKTPLFPS